MKKVYFLLFFSLILIAVGAIGYVVTNNVKPVEDQTELGLNKRGEFDNAPFPTTAVAALDIRSLSPPNRGIFFSCDVLVTASTGTLPWIDSDGLVDLVKKPKIEGNEKFDGLFEVSTEGSNRVVNMNSLPSHTTGAFPANEPSDYVKDSVEITAKDVSLTLPASPSETEQPNCIPGQLVGVSLTGAHIYGPLNPAGADAIANEIFDSCEGHTDSAGVYHYHHYSPCFEDTASGHSKLVGYALDGFGIYGPYDQDGGIVTNQDLDECHGHKHQTAEGDVYHYHMNEEFPYVVGCFKGATL